MAVATPEISVIVEVDHIAVSFNNIGSASANFLKRDGVYISKTIPDDSPDPDLAIFRDYQTRSGQQVSYVGSAFDGVQESAPTAPVTATLSLPFATLHKVTQGTNGNIDNDLPVLELFNLEGQTITETREGNVLRLAAVERPRIKTSPLTQRIVECPIFIPQSDRTTVIPTLEEVLWSNDLFCFRDPSGELVFCTVPDQETETDLNVEMTLVLWESDYSEAVS